MALVAVPRLFIPPADTMRVSGAPSLAGSAASLLMDASGEKLAMVFSASATGNIRKVHLRIGTVTTATDTDIRIETLDATTGNPSGTLWAANTNATLASGSITGSTWVSVTLTADASVTIGDLFAVVVAPSGTPNYNLSILSGGWTSNAPNVPYGKQFTASWSSPGVLYQILVELSDGSYLSYPLAAPTSTLNTHNTFNTGSTPDEIALKFTTPAAMRVCGAWILGTFSGDFDIILYASDGSTVLASKSVDKDNDSAVTANGYWYFTSTASLTAGSTYYLAVKPTSATNLTIYSFDVTAAGQLDTIDGAGQAWHYAAQTDAAGFSATTTRRPYMGLIVDQIDNGSGSGGGASQLINSGALVG